MSQLKNQLSRFLESFNNSPGLNLISAFVRLILGEFEDADGRERFDMYLESIETSRKSIATSKSITDILELTENLDIECRTHVAEVLINRYGRSVLETCHNRLRDNYSRKEIANLTKKSLKKAIVSMENIYAH